MCYLPGVSQPVHERNRSVLISLVKDFDELEQAKRILMTYWQVWLLHPCLLFSPVSVDCAWFKMCPARKALHFMRSIRSQRKFQRKQAVGRVSWRHVLA